MKLSQVLLFVVFALLLSTANARGQTSVYFSPSLVNYCLDSNGGTSCKNDTFGVSVGATHLFQSSSRLRAGIDGRFDAASGTKGGEAALVALRIAFVPRKNRISPYFQIGGGVISVPYTSTVCFSNGFSVSCDTNSTRRTGGAAEIALGFNVRVNDHFWIRPLEIMSSAGPSVAHVSGGPALGYTF